MTFAADAPVNSGADKTRKARRFQTSLWTLVVLVACCGVTLWAARRLWENYDPVLAEVRSIQNRAIATLRSGKPVDRVNAAHELERLGAGTVPSRLLPLIEALDDPATEVRTAAAEAIAAISPEAIRTQSGQEAVRNAAKALIRCLKDLQPHIRATAVTTLDSIASPMGGATVLSGPITRLSWTHSSLCSAIATPRSVSQRLRR